MTEPIIIITDQNIDPKIFEKVNFIIIKNNYLLIDKNHLSLNNQVISFNYLIIDNINEAHKLECLIDDDFVITNANLESSIEGVYCFGKIIKNTLNINEQLTTIINSILS